MQHLTAAPLRPLHHTGEKIMDEKDTVILRELQKNSRIAAGDIAVMLEVDEREVENRIAALHAARETMTQIVMRTYKEQGVEMSRPGSRDRQLITF